MGIFENLVRRCKCQQKLLGAGIQSSDAQSQAPDSPGRLVPIPELYSVGLG